MSVSQLQQFEHIWETEIEKGNRLFQYSAFLKAYPHYMEAMIASEVLMENGTSSWKHILRIPGMYYTACINIAYNYWGMQDIKNAADYFLYCTYKLKMFAERDNIGDLLKQTASIYWLKAMQLYSEFSEKAGIPMPPDMDKGDTYFQLEKLKHLFSLRKEDLN